jgi:phosphoglucosamine mutase
MFGTSGIRGRYGSDVNESLALRVANAFSDKDIAIGRDIRKSGLPLLLAASAGAASAGRDVIDLRIVPTPTVAYAAKKHNANGIMITASHNPDEYNGLKLISESKEIGKEYEKKIAEQLSQDLKLAEWDKVGSIRADNDIVDDHIAMIKKNVDVDLIARIRPKVLIDCNGAGSAITPKLMKSLGCVTTVINDSLDGFTRPSEPNEKNLAELISRMNGGGFDFALAHDGDADRVIVIDDKGEMLAFDVQLAMMVGHEMYHSEKKKIISTMEASLCLRQVVEGQGGSLTITPVGSTYVSEALEEEDALFGGEPCGEYVYKDGVHVPDAIMACAKFAELFCMKGKFSEQKKNYSSNPMAREKFQAANKYDAIAKIKPQIQIEGKKCEDDGIRVDEEDGWFLIRASGTEPIVRLTMEYQDLKKLDQRKSELSSIIRDCL